MNFTSILREHSIPHATEGKYCRPGWIQFKCPFCYGRRDPNKLYAGFNISQGYVHCWACGFHSIAKTLVELTGMTWGEAKELVGDLDSTRVELTRPRGKLVLPNGVEPTLLPAHKRYLRQRGFNPIALETIWKIQAIGIASRLQWRIFIPIHRGGQVVSWTTRSLTDDEPRYVSAAPNEEDENHRDLLYGEDFARNAIIVHEGPFDVWRTGPGAVATLGSQVSRAQINKLSRYPKRIVCFDNERDAQRRARKLCDELAAFPGETVNLVLPGKDSADSDEETIMELREYLV